MFVQTVFTASENPGNSLQLSCVKAWHQAPSILSLWMECSRFDKKLQTPTSPSGRKVWEVWGLLAEHVPSPTAQHPVSQLDLPPPLTRRGSTEGSPSTQVLLARSAEESRRGGRSSPLVVCWCCSPGCPVPPSLPWAALPACSLHPSLKTQHLNWQQAIQKCDGW